MKNEADALAFRAEKALKEYKDKVPAEVASSIQSKIDAVRNALKSGNIDQINSAKEALNQEMQKIGEAMRGPAAAGPQAGQAGPMPGQGPTHGAQERPQEEKEENNIEEAEVEVIDDDEKNK